MNITLILLKQIIIMFLLIAVGYLLCRKKMITLSGSGEIGKILLNVVIPVVIINSFWTQRTAEKTQALVFSAVVSLVVMMVAAVMASLIYGKKDGIACFSDAFSNAGFIGIPLVQAVVGADAVFYISVMIVLINFLQWTYGVYVITGDSSVMKPSSVIHNPIVIAVLIGIIIYFLNVPRFSMADTLISNITCINTPLAMFNSGVYLAQSSMIKMVQSRKAWMVSITRLLIIPIVTAFVLKVIPFGTQEMKVAIMLAAACPVGSNVAIFAQQHKKDYRSAVEQVCLSTLLCLLTIPFMIYITVSLL